MTIPYLVEVIKEQQKKIDELTEILEWKTSKTHDRLDY
jgi:hypothetical protein